MNCRHCEQLMDDYLDGELQDSAALASHLAQCVPCSRALEERRKLKALAGELESPVPEGFREKWMTALTDDDASSPSPVEGDFAARGKWRARPYLLRYGMLAAVIFVGIGLVYTTGRLNTANNAAPQMAFSADVSTDEFAQMPMVMSADLEDGDISPSATYSKRHSPEGSADNQSTAGSSDTGEIEQVAGGSCTLTLPAPTEDGVYAALEFRLSGLSAGELEKALAEALESYKDFYLKMDDSFVLLLTAEQLAMVLETLTNRQIEYAQSELQSSVENSITFYFK